MQTQLSLILASVAALVGTAAELHAIGAVRPEHHERFSAFRNSLDQLNSQATDALKAAELAQPVPPGSAEFDALRGQVAMLTERLETLALTVDHTGDQVAGLVELANAPKEA